jgi:predicted RNA binding protein YcfA (HicA-like mRNA interferase family)
MKTPRPSCKEIIKVLEELGFVFVHGKGSHMTFKKEGHADHVTVYVTKEMPTSTLHRIIKQIGITKEEFFRVLDEVR